MGSACTSVVTEYRQKSLTHTAPITLEVEHLSQTEIAELIKELVWNYRKLYLPGVESDQTTAASYQQYQRESELAWSTLEAAFKHKLEFNQEFLRDISQGAMDRIINQLIRWVGDLEWPRSEQNRNGVCTSTAQTAEECSEKAAVFMKDRLWPFTKIMRYVLFMKTLVPG